MHPTGLFLHLISISLVGAGKILEFPLGRPLESEARLQNPPTSIPDSLTLCLDFMLVTMRSSNAMLLSTPGMELGVEIPAFLDRFYITVKGLTYLVKPKEDQLVPYLYSALCFSYDAGIGNVTVFHNGQNILNKHDPKLDERPFNSTLISDLSLALKSNDYEFTGEISRLTLWPTALPLDDLKLRSSCGGDGQQETQYQVILSWDETIWVLKDVTERKVLSYPCFETEEEMQHVTIPFGAESLVHALDVCEELGGTMPPPKSEKELEHLINHTLNQNSSCTSSLWVPYKLNKADPAKWTVYNGSGSSLEADNLTPPPWLEWTRGQPNGGETEESLEQCVAAIITDPPVPRLYDIDCDTKNNCFICTFNPVVKYYLKLNTETPSKQQLGFLGNDIDTTYVINYRRISDNMDLSSQVSSVAIVFEGYHGSKIKYNKSSSRWEITASKTKEPLLTQINKVTSFIVFTSFLQKWFPTGPQEWRMEDGGNTTNLFLTTCNQTQMTCNDGLCISLDNQ